MEVERLRDTSSNGSDGTLVLVSHQCHLRVVNGWMHLFHKIPEQRPVLDVLVSKQNSKSNIGHVAICRSRVGGEESVIAERCVGTVCLNNLLCGLEHSLADRRCNK